MSAGTVLKTPYLPIARSSCAPAIIDYVLRFHGVVPSRESHRSFRYVDLGCGYGVTALYLAAAYPNGQFAGIDANETHVHAAREIADKAGLSNIEFHCMEFGDPCISEIAAADYVIANGVYSWMPEDARAQLVNCFAHLLRPGGAALISYNLMRGWLAMLPMQRLLRDLYESAPERDPNVVLDEGRQLIAAIRETTNASLFELGAEKTEQVLEESHENYQVHEFLAPGWMPVWTADLARAMRRAGCHFIGDVNLRLFNDAFILTEEQRSLLASAPSDELALTLRDMFCSRSFAEALFHRQPDAPGQLPSRLAGWLRLGGPLDAIEYQCRTPAGRLSFDSSLARLIVQRLAASPRSIADLKSDIGLEDEALFFSIVDALCTSCQILPCDPADPDNRVDRLNDAIEELGHKVNGRADAHGTPVVWH